VFLQTSLYTLRGAILREKTFHGKSQKLYSFVFLYFDTFLWMGKAQAIVIVGKSIVAIRVHLGMNSEAHSENPF
jgi:hypothetical protein